MFKKNENKQKEAEVGPFKENFNSTSICCHSNVIIF